MARGRRAPALRTRLHGLRLMCSARAAPARRALWVLAFCTALGLLLAWSSDRLLHWLAFPSHTRVRTEWSRQLPFPAVTLCNNNPLRFPRLSKGDLYYAGHWLGLLLPNRTARPLLTELLRADEARLRWFAKLADFRLFLPPRHYEGISADFMDRLGHQLEDMLLSCKYRGELCGPHNFSAVSAPREPRLLSAPLRSPRLCRFCSVSAAPLGPRNPRVQLVPVPVPRSCRSKRTPGWCRFKGVLAAVGPGPCPPPCSGPGPAAARCAFSHGARSAPGWRQGPEGSRSVRWVPEGPTVSSGSRMAGQGTPGPGAPRGSLPTERFPCRWFLRCPK